MSLVDSTTRSTVVSALLVTSIAVGQSPSTGGEAPAPTLNGMPEKRGGAELILTQANMNPGYFSPGEGPTATYSELEEIIGRRPGMIDPGFLGVPFDAAEGFLNSVYDQIGLRVGIAYTMLFQQASGGPGDRYGGSGDLDFMGTWTLLGRGTPDIGQLVATGEYRHKIGDQPANALGGVLGLLTNTTGGFNDRGWVLRDLFWLQSLWENKVRFLVGRADVSDYVGGNRLQSINNSFSNRAFSANATVDFPGGHAWSAGMSITPTDLFYVTFGAADGYGDSEEIDLSTLFDEWDLFYFAEAGLTPTWEGLGNGRYRVLLWYMDDRPKLDRTSGDGISVILEQDFGPSLLAFARYSYADGGNQAIQAQVSGGVGIRGLLGDPQNMTGFAASWGEPSGVGRDEKVIEAFHRFQLTKFSQLSVGVQGIFDPSFAPESDSLAVFTLRTRIQF